jgi:hypothetical protein
LWNRSSLMNSRSWFLLTGCPSRTQWLRNSEMVILWSASDDILLYSTFIASVHGFFVLPVGVVEYERLMISGCLRGPITVFLMILWCSVFTVNGTSFIVLKTDMDMAS